MTEWQECKFGFIHVESGRITRTTKLKVEPTAVRFAEDGSVLVVSGRVVQGSDGSDLEPGQVFDSAITAFALSRDYRTEYVGTAGGKLYVMASLGSIAKRNREPRGPAGVGA